MMIDNERKSMAIDHGDQDDQDYHYDIDIDEQYDETHIDDCDTANFFMMIILMISDCYDHVDRDDDHHHYHHDDQADDAKL